VSYSITVNNPEKNYAFHKKRRKEEDNELHCEKHVSMSNGVFIASIIRRFVVYNFN
jgi:hypothetical protein